MMRNLKTFAKTNKVSCMTAGNVAAPNGMECNLTMFTRTPAFSAISVYVMKLYISGICNYFTNFLCCAARRIKPCLVVQI